MGAEEVLLYHSARGRLAWAAASYTMSDIRTEAFLCIQEGTRAAPTLNPAIDMSYNLAPDAADKFPKLPPGFSAHECSMAMMAANKAAGVSMAPPVRRGAGATGGVGGLGGGSLAGAAVPIPAIANDPTPLS
jgi:hypothetical protein